MKLITAFSIGAVLALNIATLQQAAATNTITFNGRITDATCDVSLKYRGMVMGATGTGSIALDEVSMASLSAPGSSAGQVPFTIVAKNCSLGAVPKTKMAANFKSINGDNLGYLKNIEPLADAATNIQFRLLDSTQKLIKVNDPNQSFTTTQTTINNDMGGETNMIYFVEYYSAAGGATPGVVNSTVDYELMYF